MSVVLLTMGPPLGLVMDTPALRVGEAGVITFRAVGAVGDVKWAVAASDLPAEWGAITPDDEEATISTAEALEWGEYTITVRVVDSLRTPVLRTFSVWVEPEAITVAAGGTREWNVGTPVSLPLAITGGTGVYVSAKVASGILPAGITASVAGSTLQISGTPTTVSDSEATITVSDSREAQGMTSLDWEVTSPPKILIGGAFTAINGVAQAYLARLNEDGTLDTSFAPTLNGGVKQILIQPDGKILVLGGFTTVNGSARYRLARFHADGTLDTGFDPGSSLAYYVAQIALQSDGKIVVANSYGSNAVIRLNPDGSLDSTFPAVYANNSVIAIHVLPDDRILASGYYTSIGGVSTTAKLTLLSAGGVVDSTWNAAVSGPDGGYVQRFSRQADGKTLIAGRIKSIFGTTVSMVFRFNADLTLDSAWRPSFYPPNNWAHSARPMASGDVLCAGEFGNVYDGTAWVNRSYIAVINGSTQYPTSFAPTANATSYDAVEMPNGNILHVGYFTTVNGVTHNRISMLTSAGASVSSFTASANNTVNVVELQYL